MAPVLEQAGQASAWKPRSTLLGTLLANRYRITQPIGQGSTGAVFRAEDLLLNRPVAVRILVPSLSQQPGLISRIRARIERNVKIQQVQPDALINLVDAFDVGMTLEGEVYVVTEFLDGDHLSLMLERGGKLPWSRARHLFIRLGQILHGLHERGIVIGTLQARHCFAVRSRPKTEAIKVTSTAVLEHVAANLGPGSGLAGVQMARYAAPEQSCGEPIDARTDVYSLGVIAYELLTGRVPFTDSNPIRLVALHLHAPPMPLRQAAPDGGIAAAVEEAVLKALAKAPEDRYPTMEAFGAALSAIPEVEVATTLAPLAPSPTAPAKSLTASLAVSSDSLSGPVPPVNSAAAAASLAADEPTAPAEPAAKIAPSVVMRVLDPLPAPVPAAPPSAPAPPPFAPPPTIGPKRPPSIKMPLLSSLRRTSEPLTAAPAPSAIATPAAAAAASADTPATAAAPTPTAAPVPEPAAAAPVPEPAAAAPVPEPAAPVPEPAATPEPAAATPAPEPAAAAATPEPTPAPAVVEASVPQDRPQETPVAPPAGPARPRPFRAPPVAAVVPAPSTLSTPTDDEAPASWTAARKAVEAQVAPATVRAVLRRSTERVPNMTAVAPSSESLIADLPKRRTPWVAIVGLGAAIAAGAAAYIQTGSDDSLPSKRAPAQKLQPTVIAQNTISAPIPEPPVERIEPVPPSDPVDVTPPPPVPLTETLAEPVEPARALAEKVDDTGAKKKKSKKKTVEPEEHEEDVFDQLRKHMEAKKAAEAGTAPPPLQPTPAGTKPAADDNAIKAKDSLDRARQAVSQGNHTLAYSLARQSNTLVKSSEALELMGLSACRTKNAEAARAAANQLAGTRRTAVVNACSANGITL